VEFSLNCSLEFVIDGVRFGGPALYGIWSILIVVARQVLRLAMVGWAEWCDCRTWLLPLDRGFTLAFRHMEEILGDFVDACGMLLAMVLNLWISEEE